MTRSSILAAALLLAAPAPAAPATAPAPAQELPEPVKRIRQLYITLEDEAALNACNDYLVSNPGDSLVLEIRARTLWNLGRYEDAAKTAAAIVPQVARVKLLHAECLAMNRATAAQAQSIVDEVAADDPNAVEPHVTRARMYLSQGRLREAGAELDYVRATKPKLLEAQLLAGFLAEMKGSFDEALTLYLPLVTKPGEFERTDTHHERDAVVAVAGCYMKLQRYEEAVTLYEQLTERFPKSPAMFAQLAVALSMIERTADAIANLEKALQIAPTAFDLRTRLADLYRAAGRSNEAIAQCQKILELGATGPAQLYADLKLAELYFEAGDLDRAKVHGLAALVLAPDHEDVLSVNARVREKLGDADAAKEGFRKALAKNPLTIDAMYRLGLLLARSTDAAEQEEGRKLLERHKRIEPYLLDIRRLQRELEVNPRSPLLLTHLAGFLNLGGEYEQARRLAEHADRINPRSPSTCIQLAYIFANQGDSTGALRHFERAKALLGSASVPKLDEYIQKLKDGDALPLPLGELYRPAQKRPKEGG